MKRYEHLMQPLRVGGITLKNRLSVAPLGSGTLYGPKGEYTENAITYLTERARGGFGLIVIGNVVADMQADKPNVIDGQIPPYYAPNTWRTAALKLTSRVHVYGCKIFLQIGMGRGRMRANEKAPSALPKYHDPSQLTEVLTAEEIETKIRWMVRTAKLAQSAGFDGVEIHAMHWGYLLDQFAMAITNQRTDEYGGKTLEERLTCARRIVEGIKEVCGKDFPVSMRLGMKSYIKGFNQPSLDGSEEFGRTIEESCEAGRLLEKFGYDLLNCNSGVYDSFYYCAPPAYLPKGYNLHLSRQLKAAVNIPVLCAGRNDNPDLMEAAIANGDCDGIALGRPSLADAYYAKKLEMGIPEQIHPCISCENCMATSFSQGAPTCAVNPAAMREGNYPVTRALKSRRIAVIGGGIAGMEAARIAALRGHSVDLYERSGALGGYLWEAGVHFFKESIRELNAWYYLQLAEDPNITLHLNCEMTPEMIRALDADAVILAVGSEPLMPASIPGIDSSKAVSCIDVLRGRRKVGEKIVIVGGGLVGGEMAYEYARDKKEVTLVEALPRLMGNDPAAPYWVRDMLTDLLRLHHCDMRFDTHLTQIGTDGARILGKDGTESLIEADDVILAIGFRPRPSMASDLFGCGKEVYEIRAANGIGSVATQVSAAYEIARGL